jgi:hypothetical protein
MEGVHYQSKTILKHYHYSEALSIFTSFYVFEPHDRMSRIFYVGISMFAAEDGGI